MTLPVFLDGDIWFEIDTKNGYSAAIFLSRYGVIQQGFVYPGDISWDDTVMMTVCLGSHLGMGLRIYLWRPKGLGLISMRITGNR